MHNVVQHLLTKMILMFKSGIKRAYGDFRSDQLAVELCSIKNCEKMDDSSENISKIDSGKCITRYWLQKPITKNGQTQEMRRYCWCLY